MLKTALVLLSFALLCQAAQPVIDNERVTVWDVTGKLPPAAHDFVAISLTKKGTAILGHKGDVPGKDGEHTVVIELKDHSVPPLANKSGYPNAFPRPRVKKLFETDRVIVWNYHWNPGEPTPMHFHDKDVVVVYEEDTALKSTSPDGKTVVNDYKDGQIKFNARNRIHSELLVHGTGSAVMMELK